jgi:hypothetical protein
MSGSIPVIGSTSLELPDGTVPEARIANGMFCGFALNLPLWQW